MQSPSHHFPYAVIFNKSTNWLILLECFDFRKWASYTIPLEKKENRFPNALPIRRTFEPCDRKWRRRDELLGSDVPFDMDTRRRCWSAGTGGCSLPRDNSGLRKGGRRANLDLESASSGPVHCLELSGNRGWKGHPSVSPMELPLEGRTMSYFVS